MGNISIRKAGELFRKVRPIALEYCRLTGKPLGITCEVGEYEAARRLNLKLAEARCPGYDATDGTGRKIQIKTRRIPEDKTLAGQRLGSIRLDHEWDAVVVVVLDHEFMPLVMYEAERRAIKRALEEPGSKARNERGALTVTAFKKIGREVWRARGANAAM